MASVDNVASHPEKTTDKSGNTDQSSDADTFSKLLGKQLANLALQEMRKMYDTHKQDMDNLDEPS